MKKILFVCTGNTCRSSMAEGIAKNILKQEGKLEEIEVSSAGIFAIPKDKASSHAVEAVAEYGVDLNSHFARLISPEIIEDADIILTMTSGHKMAVVQQSPHAKYKVYTLSEYAKGQSKDILDPFGRSREVYKECAAELKEYISKAIEKILNE